MSEWNPKDMAPGLNVIPREGSGSGWRLSFKTRWLYKRETDERPSNVAGGGTDMVRFEEVLRELEGMSSEPRIKYRRKG